MTYDGRFFIQHFLICLAIFVFASFEVYIGEMQNIWSSDLSRMTTVICLLIVGSSAYIGYQLWTLTDETTSWWAMFATGLCPMIGLFGTTTGLRMQTAILQAGTSGLTPLSTTLMTAQMGVLGSILIGIMAYNLEMGIRAARR
jgi:hypothetical protein